MASKNDEQDGSLSVDNETINRTIAIKTAAAANVENQVDKESPFKPIQDSI